jgi:large subunit ribosomal protein L15
VTPPAKSSSHAKNPASGATRAKNAASGASHAKNPATGATRSKSVAATTTTEEHEQTQERIGLHSLAPAPGSRRPRKRVGRGEGSGTGKTAGRGQKGYGSRSGAKRRARFEGGQMPIHMRMRKLRGPHMKKSMPFEPFRTHTQVVNISTLEDRFEAGTEVTLELMRSKGLGTRKEVPVKVLAKGELSKALTIHAHAFSASARKRIEAAGGTCRLIDG